MSIISEYKKKTRKSAKLFAQSSKLHVNGVSHNIRFYEPYPFVVKKSSGKNLIDVDDNKYTDYWMGHWSLILGHGPASVKEKLQKQIAKSWMYGTVNEQTIKLSELISKAVPVAEKIRYVTSGTEATMYAVRLARSVTGRKVIAKIDGGWHGYTSDLLKSVNWPFSESESSGVINEEKIISIPYNNLDESLKILKKVSKDLAGIIIEPVLGGGGCIPANPEYLKGLQEYAKKNNSLFILDEIVTGFRFRFGCLYPTMKLDPDIVTLGKIVGGGMAIGVMCGKKEIMQYADTTGKKKSERSYVGGGTFSANPASMIAGHATLNQLKINPKIYSKINDLGNMARKEIGKVFGEKVIVTGKGSLFMTHFAKNGISEITNSADAARCDTALLHRYHFKMIAQDGIFFLPGKLGAISYAHSKDDIKKIVKASENFKF
ncbi:MAG: aminotransferase class III-fold pyridoxal phosphate-dependent enzyme [Nitrososphaeria archaeon]|nr:aminotransferase class III-fold pyridoxal phosphate-dependent enzyme [Nitrosopumilaceae archaeon]NIP10097.1 aminotransferase class III-fold pyridoxal phosphate-dependent enzyme [Nitrosopumilaceae archaeon]NIP91461.1 aminotransferase class III-fold pyridoxal phosphate-dependent enzyme [Nitrososphaeria archaeon]NIS95296.1 aminotransferase class III-fold pyridoxal phosphate-dependent enzyme [Nitrosopumilaceae archaeon]